MWVLYRIFLFLLLYVIKIQKKYVRFTFSGQFKNVSKIWWINTINLISIWLFWIMFSIYNSFDFCWISRSNSLRLLENWYFKFSNVNTFVPFYFLFLFIYFLSFIVIFIVRYCHQLLIYENTKVHYLASFICQKAVVIIVLVCVVREQIKPPLFIYFFTVFYRWLAVAIKLNFEKKKNTSIYVVSYIDSRYFFKKKKDVLYSFFFITLYVLVVMKCLLCIKII